MKKSMLIGLSVAMLPCIAFAETTEKAHTVNISQEEAEEIIYRHVTQSNSTTMPPKAFFTVNGGIYNETKLKLSNKYLGSISEKTQAINNYGSLALGIDIGDGLAQISFVPGYAKGEEIDTASLDIKLDLSLPSGSVRPYISFMAGWENVSIDDYDIDESTFGYGIGIGIKYYINQNFFTDLGLMYSKADFDIDVYDLNLKLKMSGISLHAGLGYRF